MSGRAAGAGASMLRGLLNVAEPFYCGATLIRNTLFDSWIKSSHSLGRPVISVGNVTTGGTGKTPMVRWLAERLRAQGQNVAILSRGYRAHGKELGDELTMLDRTLNRPDSQLIYLRANPDRVKAGEKLLREHPPIDVFLLDDGFQHRRVHRDLDIVLISAAEPFGFGHVLPRGLLREPLSGLRRAGAIVLTHADQVPAAQLAAIELEVRRFNPGAPIYRAIHSQTCLFPSSPGPSLPMKELGEKSFFAFCGIGNPAAFDRHLQAFPDTYRGSRWFGDHHAYLPADLIELSNQARNVGAEILLTTEKDWVKVEPLAASIAIPIWRVEMRMQFLDSDEARLLDQVRRAIELHPSASSR